MNKNQNDEELSISMFASKKYFGNKLKEAIGKWKEKTGNTSQEDFAFAIDVHPNMLSRYVTGKNTPTPDKFKNILKELKVCDIKKDFFIQKEYYNPALISDIDKELFEYATEIGLDEIFFTYLKGQSNFSNFFSRSFLENHNQINTSYTMFFSFEKWGRVYAMNKEDLSRLKNIQDKVQEYIDYLYYCEGGKRNG